MEFLKKEFFKKHGILKTEFLKKHGIFKKVDFLKNSKHQ